MTTSTITEAQETLNTTTHATASLVAWLGGNDVPEGYWPTDDRDAFTDALRAQGVTALGLSADIEPDDEDEGHCSLKGYMSALEIRTVRR
jgi:hypothetical protein